MNQQATPAVDYMLAQGKKKFYLLGTDYVYPQTTNLVLLEYLLSKGVPLENIGGGFKKDESGKIISAGKYTPFGHTDYQQIVAEIKQFAAGGKACVISTLNGDTNVPFFKEYAAAGLTAETCPVVQLLHLGGRIPRPAGQATRRPARLLDLLPVDQVAGEQEVRRRLPGLAQEDQRPRHREGRPRDLLADGAELRRRLSLESRGREGQELRRGQGRRGARKRHQLRRPRRQGHDAEESST